ncbi:hypothetical protein JN535_08775 [Cellulosimicrobium cellulans]|uniref:hypothetical protein n=1 Tax=Cellulosimicrobium cellulans TaxID=1710 RepID=UPI001963D93B|nr:hypothetical protein [Cellulosimicrobium cellulans]MBN0040256.1 hypothetical protein [Cellulosimicrobium cellulans]
MGILRDLWSKVHEPKAVSVAYFVIYASGVLAGLYATIVPPSSIEGEIGAAAMTVLSLLLTVGCAIGTAAALPGIYWLERTAVTSIALAMALYLGIVIALHVQSPDGNRLLQAWPIFAVLVMQLVRWVRIRRRPYRPEEPAVIEA